MFERVVARAGEAPRQQGECSPGLSADLSRVRPKGGQVWAETGVEGSLGARRGRFPSSRPVPANGCKRAPAEGKDRVFT